MDNPVIGKLADIEAAADKILEDAKKKKASLSQAMDDKTAKFDKDTDAATAKQLEEVKASLQKEMEDGLASLQTNTEQLLASMEERFNTQQDERVNEIVAQILK
ncbi:MAG TPA: hypothetical protein PLN48_03365 [Lachnospiraceae bacterium]|jgi:hypothetical protein|nr:hypothetical protein [Lachnospiraceae bacterium]